MAHNEGLSLHSPEEQRTYMAAVTLEQAGRTAEAAALFRDILPAMLAREAIRHTARDIPTENTNKPTPQATISPEQAMAVEALLKNVH
ncbi:MAG TPA: hypothetical protein VFZ58_05320 [Candidatus Saccharimonadales bacterium]